MTSALLLVPPMVKTLHQPFLGPSMLAGAARAAGHESTVVDLNQRWVVEHIDPNLGEGGPFVGDHDRPEAALAEVFDGWLDFATRCCNAAALSVDPRRLKRLRLSHTDVYRASAALLDGGFGAWLDARVPTTRPDLIGVSVLYDGQVVAALALARWCRLRFPGVPVVFGGPQVTALRTQIASDGAYGRWVDGFVAGYAERTWVQLLESVDRGEPWPIDVFAAGSNRAPRAQGDGTTAPQFQGLPLYEHGRLTLPLQLSRGCAYGRCSFCTYPAIEGRYQQVGADGLLHELARSAATERLSFKDSLAVPGPLRTIADTVDGAAHWSACTKLHRALPGLLPELARSGCRTLEVGLETLLPTGQLVIDKRQSGGLVDEVMHAAAEAGVPMVVNYMTGLPGCDPKAERKVLVQLRERLGAIDGLVHKLEHNTFELERLAPLARAPGAGVRVLRAWPWSTVLDWE